MRTVIYARYSTDNQREASIKDQVRLCEEFISQKGWLLSDTYSDAAMSGANLLRPGIQSLLNACLTDSVDIVVAEALDRISRDQEDIAGIYKRLTFAGVRLITLSEGEITDLHVGLKGTMNALFLKDLADKTRRGLRGRVEAGRSGGGNSYGYDVVLSSEDDRGRRHINKSEAKVITRIFQEYAAGKSPRKIAFGLNRDAIAGPSGKDWGPSTINGNRARGTGILNNELYIGRLVWNRLRYMKNPDTGKRVSKLNPETNWIINDVPDLRIVPQELWNAVRDRQGAMKRNTRPDIKVDKPFWAQTRPKYLLSGLMKCGQCGGSYTKISQNLFGCATARNKGTCDNRLNIRNDIVEQIILDGLKDRLMDPELFEVFAKEFIAETNRLRLEETADVDVARSELARIDRQIDKLVMAIADGADALPLNTKIKELEATRINLQQKLDNATDPEPLIHPNMAEVYRDKVENLTALLNDPASKAEAFDIIRSLIDEVRLVPQNGGLCVEFKGELAGILSLCDKKKRPASSYEERAEQVKMVAGARSLRFRTPISAFLIPTA
jgi:site-specific DNA recombinase